jgi:REP element-mobilizing transposase RayT
MINFVRIFCSGNESMNNDEPLAYFITWTVYGTFLQGDERGWRRRRNSQQLPQPKLAQWRRERMKHPIERLNDGQQTLVEQEIERHSEIRGWKLWAKSARTNHVHVVVTADGYAGDKVRDQLKANATRGLREHWEVFRDRPVWTTLGDWKCMNTDEDLETVMRYVTEAQDRMHLPKH